MKSEFNLEFIIGDKIYPPVKLIQDAITELHKSLLYPDYQCPIIFNKDDQDNEWSGAITNDNIYLLTRIYPKLSLWSVKI